MMRRVSAALEALQHVSDQGRGRVVCVLLSLLLVGGCSEEVPYEKIPGTGHAVILTNTPVDDSFSISPDGRWMIYWELLDPEQSRFDMRIVTQDLGSGIRTRHHIDPRVFTKSHTRDAGGVAISFRVLCWAGQKCIVRFSRYHGMSIDPTDSNVVKVTEIPEGRSCLDCPPEGMLEDLVATIDGKRPRPDDAADFTVAWADGGEAPALFQSLRNGRIVRVSGDGEREVIVDKPRKGYERHIDGLRVSPDGRFLAYVLFSKPRFLIPLPGGGDGLFILDLATMEEKKVGWFEFVGTPMWSRDSVSLYFLANDDFFQDMGIYVMNAEEFMAQ